MHSCTDCTLSKTTQSGKALPVQAERYNANVLIFVAGKASCAQNHTGSAANYKFVACTLRDLMLQAEQITQRNVNAKPCLPEETYI